MTTAQASTDAGTQQQTQQQTQQTTQQQQVTAADARTLLADFVDVKSLEGVADKDVLALHSKVTAGIAKHAPKAQQTQQQQGEVKYDLKLPEKTSLVQADLDRIAADAKARGLTNEQAQAELKAQNETAQAIVDRQATMLQETRTKWVEQIKADKELGGDNLATTQRLSMLPVEKFMTPELRTFLRETGYGDHPEVVRFLVKLGKAMSEDKPVGGLGGGGGDKKSVADVLYGQT